MTQRRLLFLDSHRLAAYAWQGGRLHAEQEFSAEASGVEAFREYLGKHPTAVFSILADVAEEGFQIEDVPYVSGKDRNALTSRRLGQYFFGTPFSLAVSLGREKTGRRDEKILFAALTQPRHLEPWLDAMRQAGIQLAGVFSAPFALAALFAAARQPQGPQVVLSVSRSGVRQTFFDNGKLHFSRLTPLATGSIEETAVTCAVEARKIYQYLAGQRLITRNAALTVRVLAHPGQTTAIRGHCRDSAELHFEYVDLLAEAGKVKLKTLPQDSHCEPLLLHVLAQRPPVQQFAPPAEQHYYRLWQMRSGLTAAAAVIFAACLIYAGKQYFSSYNLNADTQNLLEETRLDQRKYEAALAALPKLPIGTEDVRALVTRFEDVEKRSPLLEGIYLPLSHALDATPGVEINRIEWKLSAKLPDAGAQGSTAFRQAPLTVSGNYFAIAEVSAQLPLAIADDHRAMLQMVNQLLSELGKDKSIGVQMTQLPFDVESGKTIKGSADASASQTEAPKLAFRIVQGLQ